MDALIELSNHPFLSLGRKIIIVFVFSMFPFRYISPLSLLLMGVNLLPRTLECKTVFKGNAKQLHKLAKSCVKPNLEDPQGVTEHEKIFGGLKQVQLPSLDVFAEILLYGDYYRSELLNDFYGLPILTGKFLKFAYFHCNLINFK